MTNKKGRSPNKKGRSPNKKGRSPNKKGRSPNKKEKIQNKKIDYTKYHSTSGLSTKSWGPNGWYFLFSCIMGGYPIKIDKKNGKFTAQPTYPCFDQNLGDSAGAGNLPLQIWHKTCFFQNNNG